MSRRFAFLGVVWAYTWLVSLYALATPSWQVPDEPAHYNYIRVIAEQGTLPILMPGDYDQSYLEAIKARRFPADMSIDAIRYESHQPPLYYLVSAPFFLAGASTPLDIRLLGLRLASALWGVILLAIVYRLAVELFPGESHVPLLTASIVAFIPQHLAMLAGVENDALADVLLAGTALSLLRVLRYALAGSSAEKGAWWSVGLLMGLGFLTKTTTYVSSGLVAVAILLLWRNTTSIRRSLSYAVPALLSALLMGSVWFARNLITYGPMDWLGLARHGAVVIGQPRTLELYPSYLVAATYYFPIMFRSFWGQFGWMGVPLDARTYNAIFAFLLVALTGLGSYLARSRKRRNHTANGVTRPGLVVLGCWFFFTLVATVSYSLEFFQAQGRYLFPALGAIGVFLAVGITGWTDLFASAADSRFTHVRGLNWVVSAALFGSLVALDLICLFRFLIPGLRN